MGEPPVDRPGERKDEGPAEDVPPEVVATLVRAIDAARRRQRIMLIGYSLALFVLIGGLLGAFYLYGVLPEQSFRGWVFLAPLGLVGTILWFFGWLAKRGTPGTGSHGPSI